MATTPHAIACCVPAPQETTSDAGALVAGRARRTLICRIEHCCLLGCRQSHQPRDVDAAPWGPCPAVSRRAGAGWLECYFFAVHGTAMLYQCDFDYLSARKFCQPLPADRIEPDAICLHTRPSCGHPLRPPSGVPGLGPALPHYVPMSPGTSAARPSPKRRSGRGLVSPAAGTRAASARSAPRLRPPFGVGPRTVGWCRGCGPPRTDT